VLQCFAVCCSARVISCKTDYVIICVAVCCAVCCRVVQCVAVCCSVLQHSCDPFATRIVFIEFVIELQARVALCCVLQRVAVCCSVLQHSCGPSATQTM